ncbi:metallophosphoesterase [Robertkochia flava]|uniref:metallophosphoesterase n=1 Tax=Robertkochia flava TaxID=3447986 RepID=UPI001CCC36E6|nr:metallophosphoesterase [Robertkochia marina]
MNKGTVLLFAGLFVLLLSCATHELKVSETALPAATANQTPVRRVFLLGDAGNSAFGEQAPGIIAFKQGISRAGANDIAILLGDNIYDKGMPGKGHPQRALAEHRLRVQLEGMKDFPGRIAVIPGNHDWYFDGLESLEEQQEFVEQYLDRKNSFLPENGCGLTEVDIDDMAHLIVIDSQWFLADWDEHPTVNDDCDIKTRKRFFTEFESALKKQEGKTVIIAIHHPIDTYGPHGGYFAANKHLFPFQKKIPLPGIGSLIALLRQNGGISSQDLQNSAYRDFTNRIKTIIREAPVKAVFVSGHEHNLQYIDGGFYRQIVSGSGSKTSAAKLTNEADFTYGQQGYAVLDLYKDGSSAVHFYDQGSPDTPVFTAGVYQKRKSVTPLTLPVAYPDSIAASIYSEDAYEVSDLHRTTWGEHYRALYGIKVKAPVGRLDTLYGGLTPIRMGGGHQSETLRLKDTLGREFNMRALKKSGVKFLQTVVLNDKNLGTDDLTGTLPDRLLMDFFTAAHPYAGFTIPVLSRAAGIYHTNPELFYIPKQEALGKYNEAYGDALYMIEERPDDAHSGNPSFGTPDQIESTDKLFEELREDEENRLDEAAYLRARIFDMLIGDWDRHTDQWRFSEFHMDDQKIYRPIPRDRDQAFSDFDGALLSTARTLSAPARMVQRYEPELKNIEWFNIEPLPMDRVLIQQSTREDYLREAKHLQETLTDEVIGQAFAKMPREIREHSSTEEIIRILKERRDGLLTIANDYYDLLSELVVLRGTDKDDHILVERMQDKKTRILIRRIKDGVPADTLVNKVFDARETRELWIYALDDDDVIEVTGNFKPGILVRLAGGQNNDIYKIANGKKVKIYDYRSKPNTIAYNKGASVRLTDRYDLNHFDFNKNKSNTPSLFPAVGFNPDAGIIVGAAFSLTNLGFERNPFTSKHNIGGFYHFATDGFELNYDGEFAGVFKAANLIAGTRFTSPTFTRNFFGFGSNTENNGAELGYDYYRVNMSRMSAYGGISDRSKYGSTWKADLAFEAFEIEENNDRFLDDYNNTPEFYDWKFYLSLNADYSFENYDEPLNPRRGMLFNLATGYIANLQESGEDVYYLKPRLLMYQNITPDKALVLKTNIAAHLNIANDLTFYQAATLGGNTGLRGYRINRFTGRNALVFNGDLRYNFKPFKTGFLPLQPGIYGGYDYGRVWHPNDPFNSWHDSWGGGVYAVAGKILYLDLSFFFSDEDQRFGFGFGVNF